MHFSLYYRGHACFEFRADNAPTVLFDPYKPDGLGGRFNLPPIESDPDLILLTHRHEDHAWILPQWHRALIAEQTGTPLGLSLTAVSAFHDDVGGRKMGLVSMLSLDWCGIRLVHLGDIGVVPSEASLSKLGQPDILMVPTGGTYTIGPSQAIDIIDQLRPRWVIPMHAADPRIQLDLLPIDDFVSRWKGPVVPFCEHLEMNRPTSPLSNFGFPTVLLPGQNAGCVITR